MKKKYFFLGRVYSIADTQVYALKALRHITYTF